MRSAAVSACAQAVALQHKEIAAGATACLAVTLAAFVAAAAPLLPSHVAAIASPAAFGVWGCCGLRGFLLLVWAAYSKPVAALALQESAGR